MDFCAHPALRDRPNEGGYLLITVTIVILAIGGLLASLTFETTRQTRHEAYVAFGQHMGDLAIAAHHTAQSLFYATPSTTVDGVNLFPNLLDFPNSNTVTLHNIQFQVSVLGVEGVPFNDAASTIPSAFVTIRPVPPAGEELLAEDLVSFTEGLERRRVTYGVVGTVPAGDMCENNIGAVAEDTIIRWGTEITDCIGISNITGSQTGDIIIPTWEAALANIDTRAVMRYPQPERPDLSEMTVDMTFDTNADITDISSITTQTAAADTGNLWNLNVTNTATTQNMATYPSSSINISSDLNTSTDPADKPHLDKILTNGDLQINGPMLINSSSITLDPDVVVTAPTINTLTCTGLTCP